MEITVSLSRKDFWQFFKFAMMNRPGFRTIVIKFSLLIFVLYYVIVFGIRDIFRLPLITSLLLTLILALLAVTFSTTFQSWMWKWQIIKLPPDKPLLSGKYTLSIDGEGLGLKNKRGEGFKSWKSLKDIAEDKDYIFLFVDTHLAHIIPKREFRPPNDTHTFLNLAKLYWQSTQA